MAKQYKVSVVTPFHNTDLDVFERSFKSVINQTIGFSSIEYIIVVHNSEQKYLDGVLKLAKGKKNVKVLELHNEYKTPSSPRNHGLNYVTGKFVAFLDSDDCFYPDTLKTVSKAMDEENCDITLFRFDNIYEEGAKLYVFKQFSYFDQTKERIILERGKYAQEGLFSGKNMTVHTKMYRTSFMNDNNIRFDDGISYAEDTLFNTKAFSLAKRILLMPQLIGYQYYQNAGSAMQTYKRKTEDLYELIKLPGKIAEAGWKYGSYIDIVVYQIALAIGFFIIASDYDKDLLLAAKKEVGPYLNRCGDLIENRHDSKQVLKFMRILNDLVYRKTFVAGLIIKAIKLFHIDAEKIMKGL